MIPLLDIFQVEACGDLRWLEPVSDMEDARARLRFLGEATPGLYLVFDQETGRKIFFTVDENGELRVTAAAPFVRSPDQPH